MDVKNGNAKDGVERPAPSPQEQMVGVLAGLWVARSVSAAAKLRLADQVGDGAAKSVEELAAATKTHAPSLYRLMRGLAGAGFFAEEPGKRFRNTPLSDVLRTGAAGTMRAAADSIMGGSHWRAWGDPEFEGCLRVYVQTAGLGLLGREPYLSASRRSNTSWNTALAGYLTASGAPKARARRIALLVDATLLGLYLDWPVEGDSPRVAQAVRDLADAAQALSESRRANA